nr:immunoglobulin light chain junction region [Macaca mulatta]
CNSYADSNVLV